MGLFRGDLTALQLLEDRHSLCFALGLRGRPLFLRFEAGRFESLLEACPDCRVRDSKLSLHVLHVSALAQEQFDEGGVRLPEAGQAAEAERAHDIGAAVRALEARHQQLMAAHRASAGCDANSFLFHTSIIT